MGGLPGETSVAMDIQLKQLATAEMHMAWFLVDKLNTKEVDSLREKRTCEEDLPDWVFCLS